VRPARLATPIAVLCLALTACGGGSQVTVQEVPGGPAKLTVPGGAALAPKATATPTVDPSATATATATSTPAASTNSPSTTQNNTTAQTAPQGTQGGGAAAPNGSAQATPQPGSDAQKFEAFCQRNPGAC
jgi:hypothetical protein